MAIRGRMTAPEKRARKQLRALRAETMKTAKALGKSYPNSAKGEEILSSHQHRVTQIVQQGRNPRKLREVYPARETCQICGKPLVRPVDYWTDSLVLKFLWAGGVAGVFWGTGMLFEWWALVVPAVAWAVSFSFLWSITIPAIMLFTVILIFSLFGL